MTVSRQQQLFGPCLHLFATVFDLATNRTAKICGGSDVTVTSFTYTTHGSRAAVVVHASSTAAVSSGSRSVVLEYFLIKCETVGCADYTPASAHVWTQRFGVRMQLGCVTSSITWQMFCVDGQWQGPDNDCSPPGMTVVTSRSLAVSRSPHFSRRSSIADEIGRQHLASDEFVTLYKCNRFTAAGITTLTLQLILTQ